VDRVKTFNAKPLIAGLAAVVLLSLTAHLANCQDYPDLCANLLEHTSQYFSIAVTPPTSKCASMLASLAQVEQYFSLFSLGRPTNRFSAIRVLVIWIHMLQKSENTGEKAIITPANVSPFVINCVGPLCHKNVRTKSKFLVARKVRTRAFSTATNCHDVLCNGGIRWILVLQSAQSHQFVN
jgi:hypothetical protein